MNKVYKIKDKFLSYVEDYDVDKNDLIEKFVDYLTEDELYDFTFNLNIVHLITLFIN